MDKKRLFLIGAPKCGTTSVAEWLGRHPFIQVAQDKEPGFFRTDGPTWILDAHHPSQVHSKSAHDCMTNADAYERQFDNAAADVWRLDASTDYLGDAGACARIKEVSQADRVRILCILRDPVERMHSEYRHTLRDNIENLDFKGALTAEKQRISDGYQPLFFHIRRSQYWDQLSRWRAAFPQSDMLMISHSELQDSTKLQRKICRFLNIPVEQMGTIKSLNASRPQNAGITDTLRTATKTTLHFLKLRTGAPTIRYPAFTEEEQEYALSFIQDDVMACMKDPDIPTDDWVTCSKILAASKTAI